MKIAHLSDIHFCDKYLEEVKRVTDFAAEYLHRSNPELIILSGDLFDHKLDQNSPAFLSAVQWVTELGQYAPILILQGTYSHDVPGAISVFRDVHTAFPLEVVTEPRQLIFGKSRFLNINRTAIEELEDAVILSCLPSIKKGEIAAISGTEDVGADAGTAIDGIFSEWADVHEKARAYGFPSILISHGTVSESETEHGVPMAGLDHEFTTGSLFKAGASAVMLGHIHKHQSWSRQDGRVIAYPGSLGRLHFGEYDAKGFLMWDVGSLSAHFEFVQTPAKELYDITFDGPPDLEQIKEIGKQFPEECDIRIRYCIDEEHRQSVNKDAIRELFKGHEVKIEARIAPIQRQRAAGIGQAPSLAEKLVKWCEITNTESPPLLDRLSNIEALTTDQIMELIQ